MLTTSSALIFTDCQKDLKLAAEPFSATPATKAKITLASATNPFSLRNVQKAKATLAANSSPKKGSSATSSLNGNEPQFVYFKFNPNELNGDQFSAIKDDSTVFMLEIPFASMQIYTEEFGLDSAKAEQLKDGNIYGVTPITNTNVITQLTSRPATQAVLLDTLVQVAEEDTATQFQAFREIGYTEEQLNAFRLCLFKRPHGYVRYQDNDLGRLEPVRGMAVWALVFGIPALSFTDDNGYYQIPWRFSFGTIMGTFAKNDKVVIRPLNTFNLNSFISNFITGAMTIENWYSPCRMRDDIDFNYTRHTQARYWCQILNGYYYHYQYCSTDNIDRAPKAMVCYAQWNRGGTLGSASAPLLNFIGANSNLINAHMTKWYGFLIPTYFAFLISHQLPDNTYSVGGDIEQPHYSSQLAQTIFHELGHASQYSRVGNNWYAKVVAAESLIPLSGGYGDGNYDDGGKVQIAESWAEFMGTQYARRRYGDNGFKHFDFSGSGQLNNFSLLNIDREKKFVEDWIPTGLYFDLIDNTNTYSLENPFDAIGGSSIHNMYYVFNSNTNDICTYSQDFVSTYPVFNQALYYTLLDFHNAGCY